MFSRYKKSAPVAKADQEAPKAASDKTPQPAGAQSIRRPGGTHLVPAHPGVTDKERKRKERMAELKVELHKRLLDNLNLSALEHATESDLKQEIASISAEALEELSVVLNKDERAALHQELYDEVMGLGPLEPLLKDDSVNDILVNGPQQIFIERSGKLELTDITFKDERHLLRIIDKIVSAVGRRVDESNPYCDARLADGSRFNCMVPPIAVDGSEIQKGQAGVDDLVRFGAFTEEMAAYLQAAVATRLNVISSRAVPVRARPPRSTRSRPSSTTRAHLTIEDTAELQLQQIARRPDGKPPGERVRQGRGDPTRLSQERAQDASRPDHRR